MTIVKKSLNLLSTLTEAFAFYVREDIATYRYE